MIIQSSSVQLAQQNLAKRSFSERQIETKQQSQNLSTAANSSQVAINQRLFIQSQSSYQLYHREQSSYQSASQVVDGDQQYQFEQNQTTGKMIEFAVHGQQAALLNQQVFAVGNQQSLEVSGELEMSFEKTVHWQDQSHSSMMASGQVALADGRQIRFDLFVSHESLTDIRAETRASMNLVAMRDPLVINFDAQKVALSDQVFEFDLASDGSSESYAQFAKGSGYLVFDRNGDGKVNGGSELFGTASGNGFIDLLQYDEDGNGWIDEADSIFSQLQLWIDQADDSAVVSLAEKGVGAIYLGHVVQDSNLRSSQGELLGNVHAAGIVMMENGEVKTAQSIDLAELNRQPSDIELALAEMQQTAEAFNVAQSERLQMTLQASNPSGEKTIWQEAGEKISDFFKELESRIEKMVAERKAMLDKIHSKYSV